MAEIINMNSLGEDSLKGGIFFGSSLTPAGSFSNVPRFYTVEERKEKEASMMLTLQKVKDSLKNRLQEETGGDTETEDNIEKFLFDFTNLLIDYRDLRNYVFFGSANTEIAYNIKYIIDNYPYSTLVGQRTGNSFIKLRSYIEFGREFTEIIFPEKYYAGPNDFERVILDNYNRFNFFDNDNTVDWNKFEVVDKNSRRYKIRKVITPYQSTSIAKILKLDDVVETNNGIPYNTIRVTTVTDHPYNTGQVIELSELLNSDAENKMQFKVEVFNGSSYDNYYYNLNNTDFQISEVGTYTEIVNSNPVERCYFTIRRTVGNSLYENLSLSGTYNNSDSNRLGIVRLKPLSLNPRPFAIKIIVEGHMSMDAFLNFTKFGSGYRGFMIAPKISVVNDWEFNLTPIQKMLLAPSPINPTPWPRRDVTNNIQNIIDGDDTEDAFYNWLQSPTSMYVKQLGDEEDLSYGTDLNYEYRLIRALVLDENYSNQLVRRAVPHQLLSEIGDTEDFYFQRFILIAGWFFDQIRMYVKFVKYAHTINHTEFDQLSPEYYRFYSDHYGLDLFNDDSIDFSKLVIKTDPGVYFVNNANDLENKYFRNTIQKQQYERQKRLLLSLFYLYKIKGTHACINQLIALLGAPDGFLAFNEYAFAVNDRDAVGYPTNGYSGKRVVDNDKVNVPNVSFEIDPDYLINKNNVDDPINKPYVYRQIFSNDYVHNLREVSVHTDPNQAIDNQIKNVFGQQKYNYITFGPGEFANLQKMQKDQEYFFLPLTIPDRFFGFSVEYSIPRNGMRKGVGSNQEEATVDIFSLYQILPATMKPTILLTNIVLTNDFTTARITTSNPHGYLQGENVFITNVSGIVNLNDQMFNVQSVVDDTTFTIVGDFSGAYTGGGKVISGELDKFKNTTGVSDDSLDYSYPMAVNFADRNRFSDPALGGAGATDNFTNPESDFDVLKRRFPDSIYVDDSYIITRVEGNDLVIRLRIKSEVNGLYGERCAVFKNVFQADGLNHMLRLILTSDGAEVYKDYSFIGIAKWINISNAGPYKAYEIPKSEIITLMNESDECFDYYEPINIQDFVAFEDIENTNTDRVNWWDLFIGMPNNIDFHFKKINFFENNSINDFNAGDRIEGPDSFTSEFYVFEVTNPILNSTKQYNILDFSLPAVFYEKVPNSIPVYYGYALPQIIDEHKRNIVDSLAISNKSLWDERKNTLLVNRQQSFFNVDDIFKNNAWSNDIHKRYDYNLFDGEVNRLYSLYSSQVLTYESLAEFLDLVEGKFRTVFQQFIPIAVNILEFGRLVKNSMYNQAKMRLPDANKICVGSYTNTKSLMTSKVFRTDVILADGIIEGEDFSYKMVADGVEVIPETTIAWDNTKHTTLTALCASIGNTQLGQTGFAIADLYSTVFRMQVDYDWFLTTYSKSANDLEIIFIQGASEFRHKFAFGNPSVNDVIPQEVNNCGDVIVYGYRRRESCGSIQYSLPDANTPPVFIYFEEEGKDPIYPIFDEEVGNDAIFITKS